MFSLNSFVLFISLSFFSLYAGEIKKQDAFGRNYLQYDSDRIEFLLDGNYFLSIPSLSQLKVHNSELEALLKKKKNLEALQLVSNLKYCLLSENQEIQSKYSSFLAKWANLYNQLFAKYRDILHEQEFLIEPKLCIKRINSKEFYYLNSESFSFHLQLPTKYKFQTLRDFSFVNEGIYQWKALVFKESFPSESLDDFSLEDMLEILSKQKSFPKKRGGKLFLLFLIHRYDLFDTKLILDFWDRKRGLSFQNLEKYKFKRKFLKEESVSEFEVLDSNGELVQYECKEKIFGKKERSIGIFFVYPKSNQEIYEQDYKEISISFK